MPLQTIGDVGQNQLALQARTYYERALLAEMHPSLRVELFSEREYTIPANSGQIAEFHRFEPLGAITTPIDEATEPAGSDLTESKITSEPLEYGDVVSFTERALKTAPAPLLAKTRRLQARQIALSRDILIQTTILGGSSVNFAGGKVSRGALAAGDVPTASDFDAAILTLQNNYVPTVTEFLNPTTGVGTKPGLPSYIGFVTPASKQAIEENVVGYKSVDQYQSGNLIYPGEVGQYKEIRFIDATAGFAFAGAGTGNIDVHACVIFGSGAFGTTSVQGRQPRAVIKGFVPAIGDALGRTAWTGWKMDFARVIIDEAKITRVEFAGS